MPLSTGALSAASGTWCILGQTSLFTIGYVSRFMENPTTEHLNAVKRILRYIAGTIDYGCYYKHGGKELKLHGYRNADMGGDIDTRKSTTGVLFFLGSCPVTWQS